MDAQQAGMHASRYATKAPHGYYIFVVKAHAYQHNTLMVGLSPGGDKNE